MSNSKQRIREIHDDEDVKVGFEEEKGEQELKDYLEREKKERREKKKERRKIGPKWAC